MKVSKKAIKEALKETANWANPGKGTDYQILVTLVRKASYDLQSEGVPYSEDGDFVKQIQEKINRKGAMTKY